MLWGLIRKAVNGHAVVRGDLQRYGLPGTPGPFYLVIVTFTPRGKPLIYSTMTSSQDDLFTFIGPHQPAVAVEG